MSDFEDEQMNVDGSAVDDAMIFRSTDAKGKRSAANFSVEAEDSLPWYGNILSVSLEAWGVSLCNWCQGREVPPPHTRRRRRSPGHPRDHPQVCRSKC